MRNLPTMQAHHGIFATGTAKFDTLNIDMSSAVNGNTPLVGIQVSGPDSEVRLHNSDITLATTALSWSPGTGSAIRLGEDGIAPGKLYSTGTMRLDTTRSGEDGIVIKHPGSVLDANFDTSRTEIRTTNTAIAVEGSPGVGNPATITAFNNLIAETNSIALVYVSPEQQDYRLNVRGGDSKLLAGTYLIAVIGRNGGESNATLNLSQGYMQGLSFREEVPGSAMHRAEATNLTVNLDDGATWQLKQAGSRTATHFTSLNLTDSHLIAHNTDSTPANFTLLAEAWDQASGSAIRGKVVNTRSTIDLSNDLAGDVLTIDGNYTTGGGLWLMDAELTGTGLVADGGMTRSDLVVIEGDTIAGGDGADRVRVENLALADPTGLESYRLIQVDGNSDGRFVLDGRVVKGGYEYLLNQDANGSWYLASEVATEPPPVPGGPTEPTDPTGPTNPTSPTEPGGGGSGGTGNAGTAVIRAEVGAYEANALAAAAMFDHGWHDRLGAARSTDAGRTLWLRIAGQHGSTESNRGQLGTDHDRYTLHFGSDLLRWNSGGRGEFVVGAMAGHGRQNADAKSGLSGFAADGRMDGHGLGVYGTWVQHSDTRQGWYVDSWLMLGRYDAEVRSTGFATQHYDIDATTVSLEAGHAFDIWRSESRRVRLEPQLQLIWSEVDGGAFIDRSGTRIALDGHSLTSRLGLRTSVELPSGGARDASGFVQVDWLHAIERPELSLDSYRASFNGDDALRIGIGYGQKLSRQARVDLRLDYTDTSGGSDSIGANISLNYGF
ncbi:autotransporter family protein [Thauera sp. SDU_THAU2]|uniref:autotransporter family protein n=1 Tax=Thauera sp. SDU_THAU2 TaxID=3136633 RepID=UPI00311DFC76